MPPFGPSAFLKWQTHPLNNPKHVVAHPRTIEPSLVPRWSSSTSSERVHSRLPPLGTKWSSASHPSIFLFFFLHSTAICKYSKYPFSFSCSLSYAFPFPYLSHTSTSTLLPHHHRDRLLTVRQIYQIMEANASLASRRAARESRSRPWLAGSKLSICARLSSKRSGRSSTAMEAVQIVDKVATNAHLDQAFSRSGPATNTGILASGSGDSCMEPKSDLVIVDSPPVVTVDLTEEKTAAPKDLPDPDWSGMSRASRMMFEHLPGARPEMSLEQLARLQRAFGWAEDLSLGPGSDLDDSSDDSSSETDSDSDSDASSGSGSGSDHSSRTSSIPRLKKQGDWSTASSFSGRLAPPCGGLRGSSIPVAKLYRLMSTVKAKLRSILSGGPSRRTQRMEASARASCLSRSDLRPQRPRKTVRFNEETEIRFLPKSRPRTAFFSGCCRAGFGTDHLCDSCLRKDKSACDHPSLEQWWVSQCALRQSSGLEPLDFEVVSADLSWANAELARSGLPPRPVTLDD